MDPMGYDDVMPGTPNNHLKFGWMFGDFQQFPILDLGTIIEALPFYKWMAILFGGFHPNEKYESIWIISPSRDERKKYLKLPSSIRFQVLERMIFVHPFQENLLSSQNAFISCVWDSLELQ